MSPSTIRACLCFGDWGRRNLIDMQEIVAAVRASRLGKKRARSISESSSESGSSDHASDIYV
jgi:hypothetical protein